MGGEKNLVVLQYLKIGKIRIVFNELYHSSLLTLAIQRRNSSAQRGGEMKFP
jgi:hypothetical protein